MTRLTDITLQTHVVATAARVVDVSLTIHNPYIEDTYYITEAVLLKHWSGGGCFPFKITGPSHVSCYVSGRGTTSSLMELPKSGSLANIVRLSTVCGFHTALPGLYTLTYNMTQFVYTDADKDYFALRAGSRPTNYVVLGSISHFMICDDSAECRHAGDLSSELTYESGL